MTITLSLADIGLFLVFILLMALIIYSVRLVITIRETLHKSQKLMDSIHIQMIEIGDETHDLFQKANSITANLESKLVNTDPIFQAIEDVGVTLKSKTAAFKQSSLRPHYIAENSSAMDHKLNATDLLECAMSILKIWNKTNKEK